MKLRVQVQGRTTRLELEGEGPSLTELTLLIREAVLPSLELSAETEFSLSLNGSELLEDTGQTLASCGVVSGDLIRVILTEPAGASNAAQDARRPAEKQQTGGAVAMDTKQASSTSAAGSDQTPVPVASCWEPMLCSETDEGQAPLSLELLYHSAQVGGPGDAIMVAANLLMIETGFTPQGCGLKPAEMPAGWRCGGGVYKLQYSHSLCGDSVVMMVAVSMGSALIINGLLEVNQSADSVCKLCVDPGSYVTGAWPDDSAAAAFKDLNKLSRVFKDQLAYPLINAARHAMALPVAFGLTALPPELLLRVLRLLDVRSVLMLSAVCRHFRTITSDTALWRHLYCRDFRDSHPGRSRDTDWKELYKRLHKSRTDHRHSQERFFPPLYQNPRGIFNPPPFFPPVPGIIGGEYDQRPNFPFGLPPQGLLPRPRYDPMSPFPDLDGQPPTISGRSWQPGGGGANIRRGFI